MKTTLRGPPALVESDGQADQENGHHKECERKRLIERGERAQYPTRKSNRFVVLIPQCHQCGRTNDLLSYCHERHDCRERHEKRHQPITFDRIHWHPPQCDGDEQVEVGDLEAQNRLNRRVGQSGENREPHEQENWKEPRWALGPFVPVSLGKREPKDSQDHTLLPPRHESGEINQNKQPVEWRQRNEPEDSNRGPIDDQSSLRDTKSDQPERG